LLVVFPAHDKTLDQRKDLIKHKNHSVDVFARSLTEDCGEEGGRED
jgi:hypothetical protein